TPPPFGTSQLAAARTGTAVMHAPPVFGVAPTAVAVSPLGMAPTAVATSPPIMMAPAKKRGPLGAIMLTLFVAALGAAGTWAYMNQSIFDDTAPPPLPGPVPT